MAFHPTIVLITASYPYDVITEGVYIENELPHLRANFERVIIIPGQIGGRREEVLEGVEIVDNYGLKAKSTGSYSRLGTAALTLPFFWKDLLRRPRTIVEPQALIRLGLLAGRNQRIKRWMRGFIERERIDVSQTVFYTYWLGIETLGLGLLQTEFPGMHLVSRAHGFDLYEHRFQPAYIPFQEECLRRLERLFLISEHGKKYICSRFPWVEGISRVSRLGVKPSGFTAPCSQDGVIRMVSCAFLTDVKRIDLLLDGLFHLAQRHPKRTFEYYHLGDGPRLTEFREKAAWGPKNLKVRFAGYMANEDILRWYAVNPVDIYLNTSSAEGISVAIMEALSSGIPVAATAVGGTPEIVSEENGVLLPCNPTPEQISQAIWNLICDPVELAIKRRKSVEIWRDGFNADTNFKIFAENLRVLIE